MLEGDAVPAILTPSRGAEKPPAPSCPSLNPEIRAEAKRVASVDSMRSGGGIALAAALIR